jgi:hypothetical protein
VGYARFRQHTLLGIIRSDVGRSFYLKINAKILFPSRNVLIQRTFSIYYIKLHCKYWYVAIPLYTKSFFSQRTSRNVSFHFCNIFIANLCRVKVEQWDDELGENE